MPVLTPAELWEATGRDQDPGDLPRRGPQRPQVRPAADARGDGHVPRARDPELQAAAAALVPLPDQGPRRAAAARRAAPRARVHHEGRVLVRPRRGRARRELRGEPRARTRRIFERCGLETFDVQAESGMMGGKFESSTSSRRRARARTRSSPARTATTRPTSRSRGRSRARPSSRRRSTRPRRSRRPASRRSRRSPSSSASTRPRRRRRCR